MGEVVDTIIRAVALRRQRQKGYEDGKSGKAPSAFRTAVPDAVGATHLSDAYDQAFAQGQRERLNEK